MTRPVAAPTALFRLYRGAATLLSPLAYLIVSRKLRRHDVSPRRMHERLGNASERRPTGRLIWFHAASVGESLSILTLITHMGTDLDDAEFLITSGTATSAALIARRLPPRTRHQFVPLDAPGPVARFYDHWRPDAGIFVESELWPVMLSEGHKRGVPLALLNARLSEKSAKNWQRVPGTARFILGRFALLLTQNAEIAERLLAIGADPERVQVGSNLKATSAPLPIDHDTLQRLNSQLDGRAVWVASSTHPGEEQIVLAAHKHLLETQPDLCLLLVPRHPERGDEVAALVREAGLSMARRSAQEPITASTQVYMADTLGETGTWYALSPLVFLGGSLLPIGGHNPYEVAQAGAAVMTGPHYTNFAETYAPLIRMGGAVEVTDSTELAAGIKRWLDDPKALAEMRAAASRFVGQQQDKLAGLVNTLCSALGLSPRG